MKAPDPSPLAPLCHRCKIPMRHVSQQSVSGKIVNVYECTNCDVLQAVEGGAQAKSA